MEEQEVQLTQEQLNRIAENRAKALELLALRKQRLATEEAKQKQEAENKQRNRAHNSGFVNPSMNAPIASSLFRAPTAFNSNPVLGSKQQVSGISPYGAQGPSTNFKQKVYVSFSVMNPTRVKVTVKPYSDPVIASIKTLKSRSYDTKDKTWSVAFSEYFNLVGKIRQMKQDQVLKIDMKELDDSVVQVFDKEISGKVKLVDVTDKDLEQIDKTLTECLFPFQKAGVIFGLQRQGRILLADEMGLGKSIQALGIARYYNEEWPLLIICPSSVKYAWKTQIRKFLPAILDYDIFVIEKGSDYLPRTRSASIVIILSYDQMTNRIDELKSHSFYVIIFDESHFLKDAKAKRTKAATEIAKKANRVICLSGTPALSRPAELYSQIKVIDPKIFPNFKSFGEKYCDGKIGRFGFETKGSTNSEELVAILEKTIMIRRLKKDVLNDLPEKRREIIYLSGEAIDDTMKSLKKAREAVENPYNKDGEQTLMRYYAETAIVKAQAVGEHIVESYFYENAQKLKMLIFAHHQVVLDTISMMLTRKGVKFIRIDGTTKSFNRSEYCEKFQKDPDTLVALLSITAAGTGITLTAASHIVFAEIHWNPGTMMQAEDRAHRVGQKNPVTIQYMLARKTADDDIWPLVGKKLKMLGDVKLSSDDYKGADFIHRDCSNRDISAYFEKLNALQPTRRPDVQLKEEEEEPILKRSRDS